MPDRHLEPPQAPFRAEMTVPGDKSLSHRALLLAAMATGTSRLVGLGPGLDIRSTVQALAALGVDVDGEVVRSSGVREWRPPLGSIDAGNSATTLRLLCGALAASPGSATLVGDQSLMARPMRRLVRPLQALGARISVSPQGTAPVEVGGTPRLRGADVKLTLPSAQVRSAFQLGAVQAESASSIDSPPGFRDHTERWMEALGRGSWMSATRFRIEPGPIPSADYRIPGDPSSAAFLWAAAAIFPGSVISTPGVSLNPTRTVFLDVLEEMGAVVEREVTGAALGEPIGRVRVQGSELRGVSLHPPRVVSVVDELPVLAILAGRATGVTEVTGAEELRAKESDRIESTLALLHDLGVESEGRPDGWTISGGGRPFRAGEPVSFGDHRIAMAAAVAVTASSGPITVRQAEVASISWPGFYDTLEAVWSSR